MSAFRFIAANKAAYPVKALCEILEVSRSGFYDWLTRPPSRRACEDAVLCERIAQIHAESRGTYGARRVHAELRFQGEVIGKGRVERLMRKVGLTGLIRRKRGNTTVRVPGVKTAPDLVDRDFMPDAPNRLWVADITYLRTHEGWLYLAIVLDCFSRRVVGYSIDDSMRAELVVEALEMAVWRRDPEPGVIHHSDQGAQYVSLIFGQRCRDAGIAVSMGSRGCAYDNAVAESFFKTLKNELTYRRSWPTKTELRSSVFEYIETFYNRKRRHSTLGYRSPEEFERMSSGNEAGMLAA